MNNHFLYITWFVFFFVLFFTVFVISFFRVKTEKKILEFSNKFDDYSNSKKNAYIFAREVQSLLKSQMVAVIEYSYAKVDILASVPMTIPSRSLSSPHELYLIMKNLEQENITHFQDEDIKSEHFKKLFPIFDFDNYHILPLYTDNHRIVSLEIYGNLKKSFNLNKSVLKEFISIFQKVFILQSKFQKEFLQIKKNEMIIRFLDRIRNTLDENELEKVILEEICRAFNADRAYFLLGNKNNLQNPILGKEHLANPYVKSLRGNNLNFQAVWAQLAENNVNPPVFVIEDVNKFLRQKDMQGTPIEEFLKKSHTKSSYPFLISENDEYLLYLVLQFTKNVIVFDNNDYEIVELLTKQIQIALSQAKFYTKLLQNNKKEKFLKEIYADTINLQSKNQIYSYFSEKTMLLLNAQGVVFVEFPVDINAKTEYFENYRPQNLNMSKFKNFHFINDIINKKIITHTCNFSCENYEKAIFTKETGIACISIFPVNPNTIMVLFFNSTKDISSNDKSILFSFIDIISKTLSDFLKTAEINNLRERFLSTLTHDLQIPLVAQRNVIDYLSERKNIIDTDTQELLYELKETNNQIEDMLKALTAIYKYETKKKELLKENCSFPSLIEENISKLSEFIERKNISVIKEINRDDLHFWGDKIEINKSIMILLINAINATKAGDEIILNISDNEKYLKCCICTNGKNYSDNLKRMVFNGVISDGSLDYGIGDGIFLYLVKLIINAHGGKIYINDKPNGGSVICIELEKIL